MLDKPASALRLRERLIESERLMDETGCYDGVTKLSLRNQDPLKFETLHTKLRAYCVSAREMARRISASPGVREVGEMVVASIHPRATPSHFPTVSCHVHTMSRLSMDDQEQFEENP
jgi:acetone carboxylase alpha subunit